ncbi:hypothetical protein DPMN_029102 [Dreissena polymorpha]|uniref:Uncharacterized protein n=1 Tax=Dreissena polymorpha TaxID=45954 RepID=A0A9D4M057_DREPO|nr:hypothetical protein DPMN_029102 [Dreissena polymorpha]
MYSLYLCVCLDFIMAVADFFVKGLPSKETASTHPTHPTDEKKGLCEMISFHLTLYHLDMYLYAFVVP